MKESILEKSPTPVNFVRRPSGMPILWRCMNVFTLETSPTLVNIARKNSEPKEPWSVMKEFTTKKNHFLAVTVKNVFDKLAPLEDISWFTMGKNHTPANIVLKKLGTPPGWKNTNEFTLVKNPMFAIIVQKNSGSKVQWKAMKEYTQKKNLFLVPNAQRSSAIVQVGRDMNFLTRMRNLTPANFAKRNWSQRKPWKNTRSHINPANNSYLAATHDYFVDKYFIVCFRLLPETSSNWSATYIQVPGYELRNSRIPFYVWIWIWCVWNWRINVWRKISLLRLEKYWGADIDNLTKVGQIIKIKFFMLHKRSLWKLEYICSKLNLNCGRERAAFNLCLVNGNTWLLMLRHHWCEQHAWNKTLCLLEAGSNAMLAMRAIVLHTMGWNSYLEASCVF